MVRAHAAKVTKKYLHPLRLMKVKKLLKSSTVVRRTIRK